MGAGGGVGDGTKEMTYHDSAITGIYGDDVILAWPRDANDLLKHPGAIYISRCRQQSWSNVLLLSSATLVGMVWR